MAESASLKCRYYRKKYPEVDQLVTVKVLRVEELGAYVSLLEYEGVEGMILMSELSRRRIRSVNKLIKIGRLETALVLRVDEDKGYIDLSKRRVTPEDIPAHEDKYNKAKSVHSILHNVAAHCNLNLENLYEQIGWPLYDKFGHAYDGFKLALGGADKVFEGIEMSDEVRAELMRNIVLRLTPQPVKIRSDFEATCFAYEGVGAIKAALNAGKAVEVGQATQPIEVRLIAPPLYVATTTSTDKEAGIQKVQEALDTIGRILEEKGGKLTVKLEPQAVGEREDKQLNSLMEQLEKQSLEVSGDDDESDED
jgi:translation initiation factor 2 subunit 1